MNDKHEKKDIDEILGKAAELAQAARPLHRMKVQAGDVAVELEWPHPAGPDGESAAPVAATAEPGPAGSDAPGSDTETDAGDRAHVCAPLVGTFYHAPKPGDPPFVRPGDTVEAGQQVGILEAMKLMNPIEADQRGVVAEVLVPDGTPVEYGQPLIALAGADS
jgi:acetyl-CoA carboxylase biotin carboxyl carrier protein